MVRIFIDSAADITPTEAKKLDVVYIPMPVMFPGIEYDQARDEDFSRFYELLTTSKQFPKTGQGSAEAFEREFKAAKEAGDSVVCVLISAGLSGTVQAAKMTRDAVGHPDVHIVDSGSAIIALRILVEYAVQLRGEGHDAATIAEKTQRLAARTKVFGLIDTLTYLYKGGQLPRTVALAGNLLHIKPVITARKGVIALCGRGRNYQTLLDRLTEGPGYDPAFPVYFGYTVQNETGNRMFRQAQEQFQFKQTGMFPIGAIVGAHIGPNGNAIAFVEKEA